MSILDMGENQYDYFPNLKGLTQEIEFRTDY